MQLCVYLLVNSIFQYTENQWCKTSLYVNWIKLLVNLHAKRLHRTINQEDCFPELLLMILPFAFSLRRMLFILVSFCLSFNWSERMFHKSLEISCFVNESWSANACNKSASHC